MTFRSLVPPQCTDGMKYAFGVSIIRLRGITGEPDFTASTALARLNPRCRSRYLRALVPEHRAIHAGES
jgi:hypothetical protein